MESGASMMVFQSRRPIRCCSCAIKWPWAASVPQRTIWTAKSSHSFHSQLIRPNDFNIRIYMEGAHETQTNGFEWIQNRWRDCARTMYERNFSPRGIELNFLNIWNRETPYLYGTHNEWILFLRYGHLSSCCYSLSYLIDSCKWCLIRPFQYI